MTWQTIETAPKDGTWVLLRGGSTEEQRYEGDWKPCELVSAFWLVDRNGMGTWTYAFWEGGWRSDYSDPTHWMPLPPFSHQT